MCPSDLLHIENLSVSFAGHGKLLRAVRNLDLHVPTGRITCIVGESGCGKSLTCRAILRLTPEYARLDGRIIFDNMDLLAIRAEKLRSVRGSRIGMIFQEPMTSLNPVLTVGEQTAEPLRLHWKMGRNEARERVTQLFEQVGIPSAASRYRDYPHQLSGGMRQRVMIAMALACSPALLLADEPTTALDTTIQGQILRLILNESRERSMGVILVTHDLGVVADIGHYVAVMYAGTLVEYSTAEEIFKNPMHPYTRGLIACAPGKHSLRMERLPSIPGSVPSLAAIPGGCPFHPRCASALPQCADTFPPVIKSENHQVACWLYEA